MIVASINSVPNIAAEDHKSWMTALYSIDAITNNDINLLWETYSYKGFNRVEVLMQLNVLAPDIKLATNIIVAIALRGPQASSTLKLPNGRSLLEMGVPATGGQGTKVLTCNKIQAATADLAAFYLKKMNAPKRINMECPGWLQFPSAGGIKLPDPIRAQHREFSIKFSELIGGFFQSQIYDQMQMNAYLAENLRLFE